MFPYPAHGACAEDRWYDDLQYVPEADAYYHAASGYYYDETGEPFQHDTWGHRCYWDEDGKPYYIEEGEAWYYDEEEGGGDAYVEN